MGNFSLFFIFLFSLNLNQAFADGILYSDEISASSFLESNWNKYQENYHPNYAFDNKPETAWVEGKEGYGEGESLRWKVSKLEEASEVTLKIRNGYQKSKKLFDANSTPKKVKITVFGKSGESVKTIETVLERKMGTQEVKIPLDTKKGLSSISLEILSVYPGTIYKDTCLSDVETHVVSRVPYSSSVELGKINNIQKWTAERLKTAKFFSKMPADYPFSSSKYKITKELGAEKGEHVLEDGYKIASNLATDSDFIFAKKNRNLFYKNFQETLKNKSWYRFTISEKAKQRVLPDFDYAYLGKTVWNYLDLLYLPDISFFEANSMMELDKVTKEGEDNETVSYQTSNAKVDFFTEKKNIVKRFMYVSKRTEEARGVYISFEVFGFEYNDKGRLIKYVSWLPDINDFSFQGFQDDKSKDSEYCEISYTQDDKIKQVQCVLTIRGFVYFNQWKEKAAVLAKK